MASSTPKNIPGDPHRRSKRKAPLDSKRDQKWIDEALASGPATLLTNKEMDAIRDRVLKGNSGGAPNSDSA